MPSFLLERASIDRGYLSGPHQNRRPSQSQSDTDGGCTMGYHEGCRTRGLPSNADVEQLELPSSLDQSRVLKRASKQPRSKSKQEIRLPQWKAKHRNRKRNDSPALLLALLLLLLVVLFLVVFLRYLPTCRPIPACHQSHQYRFSHRLHHRLRGCSRIRQQLPL